MVEEKTKKIYSPLELKGVPKFLSLNSHRTIQRAVWTFAELGIADLMADVEGPITALELSQRDGQQWNAEYLYRLLRLVADTDIVKECHTDNVNPIGSTTYKLTEDGFLLTSIHSFKVRDMIRLRLHPNCEQMVIHWPSLIRSGSERGNGFEQTFGCSLFEFMKKGENREFATMFNNCMIGYSNDRIASMIPVVDFNRFKRLVDVGGGLGTLLAAVLEKHRHLHGILFDLGHVIQNAKSNDPNEFQRKQIEPDRYEFVAGDMFKVENISPADAYMMKFIIHDWNDEKAVEILKAIRTANSGPTSRVITVYIMEMVILSNEKDNWQAHGMDVEMLVWLGAKERTIFEYTDLLTRSGYQLKHVYQTNAQMSIIEAETTSDIDNHHH